MLKFYDIKCHNYESQYYYRTQLWYLKPQLFDKIANSKIDISQHWD